MQVKSCQLDTRGQLQSLGNIVYKLEDITDSHRQLVIRKSLDVAHGMCQEAALESEMSPLRKFSECPEAEASSL